MASAQKFRAMLIQLSGKISSEELEKMKFALEEEISLSDLQSIQQPFELFRLMRNKNLLSAENCDRLASLFCDIGRIDLSDELLHIGGDTEDEGSLNRRLGYAGRLPCKTPHFYGRSKLVEEIVGVLGENNGSRLVVVTGLPGYGKSCLVEKIGHTMVGRGFQVIFLCLREIKYVTKMAENILCYFNIIPGRKPCEQALSQLRSLEKKTILILDNAEDLLGLERGGICQEFSAFVNHVAQYAGNVKCVIASRISFPVSLQVPCHIVELLVLENSEASKLLKDKAQASCLTDSDAKSIAQLCLNIPLILHAAAALMTILGPSEVIRMLEAPLKVADMNQLSPDLKMRRFLNDCFQQLGTVLQEALISLAVFPAAFSHEQAMSVLSGLRHGDVATSYQQKAEYLIDLVTRSLVYSDRKSNHYFVHRVIKLFCEEKTSEEPRFRVCYDKAREQFIAHCLNVVKKVQERFFSKNGSKKSLCDYCCEERNIIQGMLWAANDRKTAIQCAKVLNESVVFLAKVMKKIDFEEIYEAMLTAFKEDKRLVADCLTCIGIKLIYGCECHRSCRSVSDRSYRLFHRAKELYDGMGLTEGDLVAQCYSKIGRCMAQNGDIENALHLTEKALKMREKNQIQAPLKYAACCNDRAVVLSYLNKHQEALTLRENALAVYIEELNEHPYTATVYNFLGNDCLALDLPDRALEYFSSALRIREKFFGASHQETARTLHDMGVAWERKGNLNEALARLKSAVVTQESVIDIPHEKLKSLELMAEVCKNLNLPDKDLQQLNNKILECKEEKARAAELNSNKLHSILRIAKDVDSSELYYTATELFY